MTSCSKSQATQGHTGCTLEGVNPIRGCQRWLVSSGLDQPRSGKVPRLLAPLLYLRRHLASVSGLTLVAIITTTLTIYALAILKHAWAACSRWFSTCSYPGLGSGSASIPSASITVLLVYRIPALFRRQAWKTTIFPVCQIHAKAPRKENSKGKLLLETAPFGLTFSFSSLLRVVV